MRLERGDIPLSMYHESEARRNLRDIAEEQREEGLRREAFSYEDFLMRVDDAIGGPPTPRLTFEDVFNGIFNEAFDLLIQRQRKYGPDNIARQGMWGVLTRIADDKIARLRRAFNGRIAAGQIALDPVSEGESDDTFEDACLDLMNYAAILLALKRGQWGRPLEEEIER